MSTEGFLPLHERIAVLEEQVRALQAMHSYMLSLRGDIRALADEVRAERAEMAEKLGFTLEEAPDA